MPLGVGKTVRAGGDVSVFCYGRMVQVCRRPPTEMAEAGVDAEVIDLRSLHPYDWAAISKLDPEDLARGVREQGHRITNFGEHLIRRAVEELWDVLRTPPVLEAGKHVPGVGLADNLENASVPGLASVRPRSARR